MSIRKYVTIQVIELLTQLKSPSNNNYAIGQSKYIPKYILKINQA